MRRQAAAAAAPIPNKGDTALMLRRHRLVLLMTVPGLALFYGGLVRTKNMLSVLMQVFASVWVVEPDLGVIRLQPRLHQRRPLNNFVGGFSRRSSGASTPDSTVETFSNGVVLPEWPISVSR